MPSSRSDEMPEIQPQALSENELVVVQAMRRGEEYIHRTDFDLALAEAKRLREALEKIKATCDGRLAGESPRASYLGVANYVRSVLRAR